MRNYEYLRPDLRCDAPLHKDLRGENEVGCGTTAVVNRHNGMYDVYCWPLTHGGIPMILGNIEDVSSALEEAAYYLRTRTCSDFLEKLRYTGLSGEDVKVLESCLNDIQLEDSK